MSDSAGGVRVWGIVPAAGYSRRMGRPKQSLALRGSTITARVAQALLDAGLPGVVVVTRSALAQNLKLPADPRVHITINDDEQSEMIDSVRAGLGALAPLGPRGRDGALVVPGDMPQVSTKSCRACVDAYVANPGRIVIARFGNRRGHPIIFPLAMGDLIDELGGGLNELSRARPADTLFVDIDDPGVTLDIDTAEDYLQMRRATNESAPPPSECPGNEEEDEPPWRQERRGRGGLTYT